VGRPKRPIVIVPLSNGCHECISHIKSKDGYTRIRHEGKKHLLTRVLYQQYVETIPPGLVIRHTCDNPSCVNLEHLLIGTQADNVRDMYDRKRAVIGSRHPLAKLNEEQVLAIRALEGSGRTHRSIAEEYNVDQSLIGPIWRREHWTHI